MKSLLLRSLLVVRRSQSVVTACWIGGGGVALMGGNLLLAGILPRQDFGRLILFQSLLFVGVGLAPLGLDSLIVRRELSLARVPVAAVLLAAAITALFLCVAGSALYQLPLPAIGLLAAGCLAGAPGRLYAASEQTALRFRRSQFISQVPFLAYALGVLILWLGGVREWTVAAALLVGGHVMGGVAGAGLQRLSPASPVRFSEPGVAALGRAWPKALAFAGLVASLLVLNQMERLVAGRFLTLDDVATLGVALTIVGSPYRLLAGGITHTLAPYLSYELRPVERLRLVRGEIRLSAFLGLAGGGVLLIVAEPVITTLYNGSYDVPRNLVLAIVSVGMLRLLYGCGSAAITALGQARQLAWLNLIGWIATVCAAAAAFSLSRYGLAGVVAGVGCGWAVRLAAAALLFPAFRPAAVSDLRAAPLP